MRWLGLIMATVLAAGCGSEAGGRPTFTFSRMGGVLENVNLRASAVVSVKCGGMSREIPPKKIGAKILLPFSWTPEATCTIRWGQDPDQKVTATAPRIADPVSVLTMDLESLFPRPVDQALENEISFLAFSSSGRFLAVGTVRGHIRVFDLTKNDTAFRTRITEGRARAAVFSPDERTLFIGEQTQDAFIRAVDLQTGNEIWRYRLADDLGETRPWNPGDKLAWVLYPAPYRMTVTAGGDLLVGALHNWYPKKDEGVRQLSHLYRFDGKTGSVRWKWPEGGPAPLALTWFGADQKHQSVVGILGTPRSDYQNLKMHPGLYAVDVDSGVLRWKYHFSPLRPQFKTVSTWRGVAVHPAGKRVNASTGDGRLYILENGIGRWMDARGGPVVVSGFPIVAETGSVGATQDFAIFVLGGAYIPIRTGPRGASGNHPHPNANAVFFFDWEGNLKWRWQGPNRANGLAFSGNRRWMAVALSKSRTFRRDDTNGIVLFDTKAAPGKNQAGAYWIEGVIPYDQVAMSQDGSLIALVETPAVIPDGRPAQGGYRLHVLF